MEIGKRIENIRKRKGISAEDLAETIGVSPSTIYRYENSDISNMGIDKLKAIAAALGTQAYTLLGWGEAASLSSGELTLLERYRALDRHGKELVDIILQKEYERCAASQDPSDKNAEDFLRSLNATEDKKAL